MGSHHRMPVFFGDGFWAGKKKEITTVKVDMGPDSSTNYKKPRKSSTNGCCVKQDGAPGYRKEPASMRCYFF